MRSSHLSSVVLAIAVLSLAAPPPPASAADVLLPGKVTVVKLGKLGKFVAKPANPGETFALPAPGSAGDPTTVGAGGGGGELNMFDTGAAGAGSNTYPLPSGVPAPFGWKGLGTPPGSKGYKYRGTGQAADPCRVVLVKEKVVKGVCKGAGVTLQPPFTGDAGIVLSLGAASTDRYCALFGGSTVKNTANIFKRKLAPAPASCPSVALACTCGSSTPEQLTFAPSTGAGNCGSLAGGTVNNDLACNGLYFGGGQDAVPLPITVPDFAQPTKFRVDDCSGNTLTIGGTSSAEVGGPKRCTTPGCFFGPPLPVPNTLSGPTSTCLYNVFSAEAQGTFACDTGAGNVDVPIFTGVFLTGDVLPNRCQGGTNPGGRCTVATQVVDCPGGNCQPDPDLQPCPICNPATGICNGGMDNGMACVPGSTQLTTGVFPTSHDCRVSTLVKLGDLDITLGLTTGTSSDTAAPSGTQARVFCGFCRDADDTLAFQGPPAAPCQSDAECAQPFESCEQRSQGAFANGAGTEISLTGSPAGSLADFGSHNVTLVTAFCVPPVYSAIIDGQADLPGPGALSAVGTVQLSDVVSPSGAFLNTTPGSLCD